jgi:hypothetical protein
MSDALADAAETEVWSADPATFVRGAVFVAVVMALATSAALFLLGNRFFWIGAVASFAVVAVRAARTYRLETGRRWDLSPGRIVADDGQSVALAEIDRVRRLGSAVQVTARDGTRLLLRHLAEPAAVSAAIDAARRRLPVEAPSREEAAPAARTEGEAR